MIVRQSTPLNASNPPLKLVPVLGRLGAHSHGALRGCTVLRLCGVERRPPTVDHTLSRIRCKSEWVKKVVLRGADAADACPSRSEMRPHLYSRSLYELLPAMRCLFVESMPVPSVATMLLSADKLQHVQLRHCSLPEDDGIVDLGRHFVSQPEREKRSSLQRLLVEETPRAAAVQQLALGLLRLILLDTGSLLLRLPGLLTDSSCRRVRYAALVVLFLACADLLLCMASASTASGVGRQFVACLLWISACVLLYLCGAQLTTASTALFHYQTMAWASPPLYGRAWKSAFPWKMASSFVGVLVYLPIVAYCTRSAWSFLAASLFMRLLVSVYRLLFRCGSTTVRWRTLLVYVVRFLCTRWLQLVLLSVFNCIQSTSDVLQGYSGNSHFIAMNGPLPPLLAHAYDPAAAVRYFGYPAWQGWTHWLWTMLSLQRVATTFDDDMLFQRAPFVNLLSWWLSTSLSADSTRTVWLAQTLIEVVYIMLGMLLLYSILRACEGLMARLEKRAEHEMDAGNDTNILVAKRVLWLSLRAAAATLSQTLEW